VKILEVTANNRRRAFDVRTGTAVYPMPYVRVEPRPQRDDRIAGLWVDPELGREAFTFRLESGREGTVHIEQVLDYNRDPRRRSAGSPPLRSGGARSSAC
jgi:hypothetical protein